jgi:hypothetical protein
MSLITSEQDDPAVLRAEDEAIRAAENPTVEAPVEDIAALIERLTNGNPTEVPTEDRQG